MSADNFMYIDKCSHCDQYIVSMEFASSEIPDDKTRCIHIMTSHFDSLKLALGYAYIDASRCEYGMQMSDLIQEEFKVLMAE